MHFLTLYWQYCLVLGQTYYHSPDPVVFFDHDEMVDGHWQVAQTPVRPGLVCTLARGSLS